MPRRALLAPALVALALATLTACGSGDDDGTAPVDAADRLDAPAACNLPTATIACTVGNDAPCTAVCGSGYCYNFNQVGVVCTKPCSQAVPGDCPSGWTCNNMGRCRPPG